MTILTRRTALALAATALAARAQAASKLTYWHHFTSQEEFTGLKNVMALFQQRFPDIALTQENIPNPEYMTKFTAAVMAKSRPDVSMVVAERLPDMLAMDGLIDVTARVDGWKNKANFPSDRWLGATSKGKIYGVPAFTFIDWVYYRKDWFEEAGIAGPPTTLDEFVATAKKLTDPSKNRYGFGMRGGPGGAAYLIDLIESFGSPFVIDGKNAMDRAKTLAAVKWYSDLATVHKVVPPSATNDGFRQIMEGFKTGQTAMTWHHTGSLVEMVRALKPAQFGTAAKPAGPAARVARLTYLYNGLMKKDNEQAAWDWISFWGEPDPSIAFLNETGYFPASIATAKDPRITGNPLYKSAAETLGFGRLPPAFVGLAGWSQNVVLPEFQKILVGQSTAEKATDAMLKGLDATIN
ncbi:MAG: sugar ABC transporter substrate-binding protein [Acetobacteraceae bacterium]|nr:sugar ABC transporter substrate-binding protein [Acetobacteraceae bacterium]